MQRSLTKFTDLLVTDSLVTGLLITGLLITVLSACAPQGNIPTVAAATTEVQPFDRGLAAPTVQPSATLSPTVVSFELLFTPVPTETPLPTLELPTPLPHPPVFAIWDGLPTYPSESRPGFYFRLLYDPETWALTIDNYGDPALGHRAIPYCVIAPAFGHGLPRNLIVEHDLRKLGKVSYEINSAYLNGVKQFVTYLGGDANIYTGFEVTFQDQPDQCLQEAEAVLSTLVSVPASDATPAPTP